MRKHTKYTIAFIGITFIGLMFSACGKKESQVVEKSYRPVRYVQVDEQNVSKSFTFSGVSQSEIEENLSFKVSGTISKMAVKVGDKVRKGQLLVRIDPSDYAVTLNQAQASQESVEAQVKSAEASYIASKSAYNRAQKLYETKSISLSDFEQAKAQYEASISTFEAAKSQASAAKSQTQAANNQVNYTQLRATINGVVSAVHINENEIASPGKPIVTLSSSEKLQVEVGVPENSIRYVEKGQAVQIVFSSLKDTIFSGQVQEVGYAAQGATYPVTVLLKEQNPMIRPDMPADVTFIQKTKNGVSQQKIKLPTSSVGEDAQGNFVYTLEKTEKEGIYVAKKTSVQVGPITESGFELLKGVPQGALIASAGLNMLRDGAEVKLYTND